MAEAFIQANHLKKYFKTPRGMLHAVDDVTLSIPKGKTLGIVGESGCGKSTLGRLMLNLLEPTSGEMLLDGQNIYKLRSSQMKKMRTRAQMIFQDPYSSLNPRMSVSEIIAEPIIANDLIKPSGHPKACRRADGYSRLGTALHQCISARVGWRTTSENRCGTCPCGQPRVYRL